MRREGLDQTSCCDYRYRPQDISFSDGADGNVRHPKERFPRLRSGRPLVKNVDCAGWLVVEAGMIPRSLLLIHGAGLCFHPRKVRGLDDNLQRPFPISHGRTSTGSMIMSAEKTIRNLTTIAELKDMIVATRLSLPEQQERVARTALAHPEIVAFGTAQSLADRCEVSPSTVVRVATALGFDNFREFRQVFRQHIREISIRAADTLC
ncbi:hypothetical protein [Mesorhizobium sp. M1050]|uniref:MurR/RpiR family transcriptional regulator n=2 Tax=Mesorhizobium TaxID=68287 RepID=UPI00333A0EF0